MTKTKKNNNLSQEQLAEQLGVSRQAVSNGRLAILSRYGKMLQMCQILNCHLEDLMDRWFNRKYFNRRFEKQD
ncbi:MAG: helix-turn-helix transcriptional regulator [Clostridia bacterium]